MGAQLALQAHGFANACNLAPLPRVLLSYMALKALDSDSETGQKAARSFMTRPALAVGIGRFMPDRQPAPDAPMEERLAWEKDDQAVKRALAELRRVGAIRTLRAGYSGRSSEYEICLTTPAKSTSTVPLFGTENVPKDVRSVPERGITHRPPKEPVINHEETETGQPQAPATAYVHPVDKTLIPQNLNSPPATPRQPTPLPAPYLGARRIRERESAKL